MITPSHRKILVGLGMLSFLGLIASPSPGQVKPASDKLDKDHAVKMAKGLELFKSQVKPILVQKCLRCHGGAETQSGLNLSDRDDLLRGGNKGPAITLAAGKAKESLLYKLVHRDAKPAMPYKEAKLTEEAIAAIVAWIELGAPYDGPLVARKSKAPGWTERVVDADARKFWAFQPLVRAKPPGVKNVNWVKTPIDRFILAKLEAASVKPNVLPVSRNASVRRVYFDLVGLPPSPEEVAAFVNDPAPDAYEKLLDRLVASPHFGERWARHWLDLARFAESHGFEHDTDRPSAYHYRDFVIKAINDDLPYNTFVKWQLAGDEYEPDNPLAQMATGYLAAGVHSTQITKNEVEKHRYDEMDDQLATIGTSLLGLTFGCARCHDHKYDPIPQRDYYRMLATFTTTVRTEVKLNLEAEKNVKVLIASEGLPAIRLHTQGGDFFKETYFLGRGDTANKDGIATQSFLQVLMKPADQEKHWQTPPPKGWRTSYRRRAMAEWLTDVDQGAGHLLARVIVNRLWQQHMGRGLVATPSDFGSRGEPPSHPELLDWLASELIRNGWRLKPIHKMIMTSNVYRQSSVVQAADSDNRLFSHWPARRLEAEIIRDNMLAVGGVLDDKMFGPGTLDEASKRRSIYFTVKRSKLIPMLQVFDAPDASGSIPARPTTTIAPQALLLMNNPHVRTWALSFARRVGGDPKRSVEDVVKSAYVIALSRQPSADELADAIAFVNRQSESYRGDDRRESALADFCQVLMCLNEFVYVE